MWALHGQNGGAWSWPMEGWVDCSSYKVQILCHLCTFSTLLQKEKDVASEYACYTVRPWKALIQIAE